MSLNSEARGTVEGVRWLLTRRAGTAIAVVIVMTLVTLNYHRYMTTTQETERKMHAKEMAATQEVVHEVKQGSTMGLSEEVLLAPEGVSGG